LLADSLARDSLSRNLDVARVRVADPDDEVAIRKCLNGVTVRFEIVAPSQRVGAGRNFRRLEMQAKHLRGRRVKSLVLDRAVRVGYLLHHRGRAQQVVQKVAYADRSIQYQTF